MSCPDSLHDYEDWGYDAPETDDEWLDDFQGEEEFA
jgi:hypothetical protein